MFKISAESVYKIQHQSGLFRKIGNYRPFGAKARVWNSISNFKQHLTKTLSVYPKFYDDCEVVEYKLVEVARYPVSTWYGPHAEKLKAERRASAQKTMAERARAKELEERELLARLQAKYGE